MLGLLLLTAGGVAIALSLPQLFQLIKLKRSDEFNLWTWGIWLVYQLIALSYSLSIHAYAYVVVNALWCSFYALMIVLIFTYRPKPKRKR
jgi:hypothetical protein